MIRALTVVMLLALAGTALGQDTGQDAAIQAVYASMENNVRREYDVMMDRIGTREAAQPGARFEKLRLMWSMIFYNRAVLLSTCMVEAEQVRPPGAPRVAAQDNLMLTTCVEERLGVLTRFTDLISYASLFFPDRIDRCGEAVRLRDREQLLPPYDFLRFAAPQLYDFSRFNACLMKNESYFTGGTVNMLVKLRPRRS